MSKKERQDKLLEIIGANEIDTQEELVDKLNEFDFNVTQATVSRDIKELKIIKIFGKTKKYRYSIAHYNEQKDLNKLYDLFRVSVLSVVSAQNMVVVKTLMGNGMSAGTTIDKMNIPEVVGCVSGDDTILIVTKSTADALIVEQTLKELM